MPAQGRRGPYHPDQRGYESKPVVPKRKWWQYLPFLSKSYDDALAQYSSDMDTYWWEKNTQYTDPKSEVERWQEAGLSPALMYGQSQGSTVGEPKAELPGAGAPEGPFQLFKYMLDTRMNIAQVKKMEAEADLTGKKGKTEEVNFALNYIKKQLTDEQYKDLASDVAAKDMSIEDLIAGAKTGKVTPREMGYLNKYQSESAEAENKQLEVAMKRQMIQWLSANNLTKWIPLMNGLLRIAN